MNTLLKVCMYVCICMRLQYIFAVLSKRAYHGGCVQIIRDDGLFQPMGLSTIHTYIRLHNAYIHTYSTTIRGLLTSMGCQTSLEWRKAMLLMESKQPEMDTAPSTTCASRGRSGWRGLLAMALTSSQYEEDYNNATKSGHRTWTR